MHLPRHCEISAWKRCEPVTIKMRLCCWTSPAGTRSDIGRDCRDAFLGLAKTCAKLGIAFWDYLGDRLAVPGTQTIPPLSKIILARARAP